MPESRTAGEDPKRHWNAEQKAVAHLQHERRKPGNVSAVGQEFPEAAQEDHHRQGHQDRACSGVRDDGPHDPSGCRTRGKCRADPKHDGNGARFRPALRMQHPGHREPGYVGREGYCQVKAAGDQRHQHGQRKEPQFGQLERHRNKCVGGKEAIRGDAHGRDHDGEESEQTDDVGLHERYSEAM